MAAAIVPILTIALQAEPMFADLVKAVIGLTKKYPQLTPAQILSTVQEMVTPTDAGFNAVIQEVAAYQAAQAGKPSTQSPTVPPTPPPPAA